MQNLIEIKNLNMRYPVINSLSGDIKGYVFALNNVNLTVYQNEILALVGESGSGKSTLGNCILKLLNIHSGEIRYKGENIFTMNKKQLREFRKNAQLIFQNPYMSLNPRMKIYDILKEPFIVHGIKDNVNERIKKTISLIGMQDEVLNRYPHEFSGGQRQRIAIARAIILTPDFIVADEPVSALDVSIQAQIINLLLELKQNLNLTMLFISHDLSVVKYISDRIAVMYLGEIVEIAPKEEFFNNHKHPYSQALLDAVPTISPKQNKTKIILDGDIPSPINLPKGCKFHTRCPFATDKCKLKEPENILINENHCVKCFLYET